jgi:recombinational DNA repair protein (RecF pathway)
VVLFTQEFWKITAWSKKSYTLSDIGGIVEILVERKKQENIIHSVTPLFIPKNDGWNYNATIEYLKLFLILKESLPEWVEHREIFNDTKETIEYLSNLDQDEDITNSRLVQLFILMKARLLKKQWYLREDLFKHSYSLPTIYSRLDTASMKSMIYSKDINAPLLWEIDYAVSEWIHTYKNRT